MILRPFEFNPHVPKSKEFSLEWKKAWGSRWGGSLSKECHIIMQSPTSTRNDNKPLRINGKYVFNEKDWKIRQEPFGMFLFYRKTGYILVADSDAAKMLLKFKEPANVNTINDVIRAAIQFRVIVPAE